MPSLERPALRPISARAWEHEGRRYAALEDPLRVFTAPVLVPVEAFLGAVRHFDGRSSLAEIQARYRAETGQDVTTHELQRLVAQLDRALVLDGPAFEAFRAKYRNEPTRPAAFAGRSYEADPARLRAQLRCDCERGAGTEPSLAGPGRLRGVLSPHIDFGRGGPAYSWAYLALADRCDADIFVILGVAHQACRHRFALTSKDFATPLGLVRTDRDYVERLAGHAGRHLFDDELVHKTEHSVEFQAVWLQYMLGGRRDFTIVPVLVGSFQDLMRQGTDPIDSDDVRSFVSALRAAESASGKRVAYIGGIDLCHVGPEFGDPEPVGNGQLATVANFDQVLLGRALAGDPAGWFTTAAEVGNRWRVCGLAATYTMLHALGPVEGELLKYGQAVNPERSCCVTFASVALSAPRHDG